MRKKILIFIGIIGVLIGGYFTAQILIKKKIVRTLSEQKYAQYLHYDRLNFNLLQGNITLDSVSFNSVSLKFQSKGVDLKRISLLKLIFTDNIKIKSFEISQPKIKINQSKTSAKNNKKDSINNFKKEIQVETVVIENGEFTLNEENSTILKLSQFDTRLEQLKFNHETLQHKIPFVLKNYTIEGKEMSYLLNTLQTLKTKHFKIETHQADFKDFHIQPNYSREEYVNVIPYEKDLMNISIKNLHLSDYSLSIENDGQLKAKKLLLDAINANIYRNKLVKDDPNDKELYSKMLRDLSFKLSLDTLQIQKTDLTYEEVQENTKKTGKVFFKDLKATGTNISNINMDAADFKETKFHITSQFMGNAPLTVDWVFMINDPKDRFRIIGNGAQITADDINNFFIPGMNMKAEGKPIKTLFFDFKGDAKTANGDFKMEYDDLKINVLKKNGEEQNKVFTAIANVFVSHKNEKHDDIIRVEDVERDTKRSFWNYLWQSVFTGLKETML